MITLAHRIANRSKDFVLFNPFFESFWVNRMRGRVAAMLYHQVQGGAETEFLTRGGSPNISAAELCSDLTFFKKHGARFFTFADLIAGQFPEKDEIGIAVCFDDCFLNNYVAGLSVLNDLSIPATFFQTTALVDATDLLWEHKLYWHTRSDEMCVRFVTLAADCLGKPEYLSYSAEVLVRTLRECIPFVDCERVIAAADEKLSTLAERTAVAALIYPSAAQVRSAAHNGHEIASHGHRHLFRASVTRSEFSDDLKRSAQILSDISGRRPQTYSFPFDNWTSEDQSTVLEIFKAASTVSKKPVLRDGSRTLVPRFTWPGAARNAFRHRRWLVTGMI